MHPVSAKSYQVSQLSSFEVENHYLHDSSITGTPEKDHIIPRSERTS